MIKKYNNISLAIGIPGILLQIGGHVVSPKLSSGATEIASLGGLLVLVGTVLLITGLAFYAKSYGRSMWFCLFGFFSIFGLFALVWLKDKTVVGNRLGLLEKLDKGELAMQKDPSAQEDSQCD